MKKSISVFTLLAMAMSSSAQNLLDNNELLRLVRSGISEEMVLNIVRSQPGNYVITGESLGALRQAGASDRVIAAVMQHGMVAPQARTEDELAQQPGAPYQQALRPAVYRSDSTDVQSRPQTLNVRDGTPIRLRLNRMLSSENVQTGDKVDFDVMDEIRIDEHVLIPRGTKAIGAVTEAEHKRRMGRGGKLSVALEYITLTNGTKIALRANQETRGGGHAGAMTAGIVATAMFVSLPAAPLFLLIHGKAAVMPEATIITAYVDGDVQITLPQLSASAR